MADSEIFMTEMYDEGVVTEVIRPAAIVPEEAAIDPRLSTTPRERVEVIDRSKHQPALASSTPDCRCQRML